MEVDHHESGMKNVIFSASTSTSMKKRQLVAINGPFLSSLLSLFVSERECRWFIFTPNWNNLFTTLTVASVGLSASHNAFTSITCNKNVPKNPLSQIGVVFSILIISREIDPKKSICFASLFMDNMKHVTDTKLLQFFSWNFGFFNSTSLHCWMPHEIDHDRISQRLETTSS